MSSHSKANGGYSAQLPLHVQVRELIRQQAIAGEIVDKQGRLRSEVDLIKHFGVSRMTIRSALAPLVQEGLFDRTRGRGTFLRSNASEMWMGRLMGFQELVKEAGFEPGARILLHGMVRPEDASIGEALRERAVWQLRRVRYADEVPTAIEHAYYPPDIGLELEHRDLVSIAMYRVFEEELSLTLGQGNQTIGARLSAPEEDAELGIEGPGALISMERLTLADDGRPVELLRAVYRPDMFQFSINLTRRLYSAPSTS